MFFLLWLLQLLPSYSLLSLLNDNTCQLPPSCSPDTCMPLSPPLLSQGIIMASPSAQQKAQGCHTLPVSLAGHQAEIQEGHKSTLVQAPGSSSHLTLPFLLSLSCPVSFLYFPFKARKAVVFIICVIAYRIHCARCCTHMRERKSLPCTAEQTDKDGRG